MNYNLNYWKGDYDSMRRDLLMINWEKVLDVDNVNKAWISEHSTLVGLIREICPQKIINNIKQKKSK